MKVLITGATGFVGHHLISILKDEHQIIGIDRNPPISDNENVNFQSANILDKDSLFKILEAEKPDGIIHLAAIATTWANKPEDVFKVNLLGTLNLYESIIELKKTSKYDPKIIFVSSAEVYGKVSNPEKISEQELLNPLSFYGVSKVAGDRLSFQVTQSHKLRVVIIRPFSHTGPGQQKGFFVPDMASQIVEIENTDQTELLVGNIESTRDYLDVRDVVRVYKYFLENDFTPGDIFNISSGKGIKIEDILKTLLGFANKDIQIKHDPTRLRPTDAPILIGDNTKLINTTGWSPQIPIEQTLKESLDYWRGLWKDRG
jgi:GDP-4-dehydro-6-deoxy-D-mannose reductase